MEYKKKHLSYEEQADLLISRNLQGEKNKIISILKRINYYRLTGYLYPFKISNDKYNNCNINTIEEIIIIEKEFSKIIYLMVRDFELGIKTKIVYKITKKFGALGYLKQENLPCITSDKYAKLLKDLSELTQKKVKTEPFVKHFIKKYGDYHEFLPLWMACEIMTIGMIFSLYKGLEKRYRREIAEEFHTYDNLFESWFLSINELRNIIAHHGRIWKRELGLKPKIPKKKEKWHKPIEIKNNKIFGILSVIYYLLTFFDSPVKYKKEIKQIFKDKEKYYRDYGFPENWEESKIWKME